MHWATGSDVIRAVVRRPAMRVVMRRRQLAATAHEVASMPDPLADHARMRLGSDRDERRGARREYDKR